MDKFSDSNQDRRVKMYLNFLKLVDRIQTFSNSAKGSERRPHKAALAPVTSVNASESSRIALEAVLFGALSWMPQEHIT